MNNKHNFDDVVDGQYYNRCLTEADFYPPTDNRCVKSNVKDIAGGDNFADYCEYIFDLLEEDGYYE